MAMHDMGQGIGFSQHGVRRDGRAVDADAAVLECQRPVVAREGVELGREDLLRRAKVPAALDEGAKHVVVRLDEALAIALNNTDLLEFSVLVVVVVVVVGGATSQSCVESQHQRLRQWIISVLVGATRPFGRWRVIDGWFVAVAIGIGNGRSRELVASALHRWGSEAKNSNAHSGFPRLYSWSHSAKSGTERGVVVTHEATSGSRRKICQSKR